MMHYRVQHSEKQLILSFARQKEYHLQVGLNGVLVSLASEFEKYLRRLVTDGVAWINERLTTYEDSYRSYQTLVHRNIALSGEALATIDKGLAEAAYDYELLCERLGSCHRKGGKLLLNAVAFGAKLSNANADRVDEALKRLGLELDWDRIGDDKAIRTLMEEDTSRRAAKAITEWLRDFIKQRNKIVHGGIGVVMVTEEDVDKAIDILRALGGALAKETEALLTRKQKAAEKK